MVNLKLLNQEEKKEIIEESNFYYDDKFYLVLFLLFIVDLVLIYYFSAIIGPIYIMMATLLLVSFIREKFLKKKRIVNNIGIAILNFDYIEFSFNSSLFKTDLIDVEELKIFSEHYVDHYVKERDEKIYSSGILKIQYKSKGKEEKHFNAIIENLEQFNLLKLVLTHWYLNHKHITIKEYPYKDDDRLLLMERLPEYDKLQVLKKELGIKSIYS